MKGCIKSKSIWFSSEKIKMNFKDKAKISFSILLDDNSLFKSYLYLEDKTTHRTALFQISGQMSSCFVFGEMTLYVKLGKNYENQIVTFTFENVFHLEMMASHFGKSNTSKFERDDEYKEQNQEFLHNMKLEHEILWPQNGENGAEASILSPLVLNREFPEAKTIWKNKSLEINTQFYIKKVPLRFNFLTWNVGSKEPKEEEAILDDLSKIFSVPYASADFVVVALEEIDMSVKSVVTGNSANCKKWGEHILKAATRFNDEEFDMLYNQSLGGVCCCALVRRGLHPKLISSNIEMKKLGANGMLANKAAVVFSWKIGYGSFSAICCHLAAHDGNCEQRNMQWHEIVQGLDKDDYNIFMGDLNYRINRPRDVCLNMIKEKNLHDLYKFDQLKITQESGDPIKLFEEPEPKFPPSYKFDVGKDVYDTSPKQRVPSWTDRILIRTSKSNIRIGLDDVVIFETDMAANYIQDKSHFESEWNPENVNSTLNLLNYPSKPENICYRSLRCQFSDHRPVHASYKFPVPFKDDERYQYLEEIIESRYEEIVRLATPKVSCNPQAVVIQNRSDIVVTLKNESLSWAIWQMKISRNPNNFVIPVNTGMIPALKTTQVAIKVKILPPNLNDEFIVTLQTPFFNSSQFVLKIPVSL